MLGGLYEKVVGKLKKAAVVGGTAAGAWGGAKLGAAIGSVIAPGVGTLVGGGVGALAGGIAGNLITKNKVYKKTEGGDPPPTKYADMGDVPSRAPKVNYAGDMFSEKSVHGYSSVAMTQAGSGGSRIPLNTEALSHDDVALGSIPSDPRKQGWNNARGWMSKAKLQRDEERLIAQRLQRRAAMASVSGAEPIAMSSTLQDDVADSQAAPDPVWRGFRTFMPDGRKAYLKDGKYEAVDEWDANDGTQGSGGGWLSKLFGGISGFAGNIAGGVGDLFGAKGKVVGGGTIDWRGKDANLKPGLIKRINLLAQQSGERLIVTDGYRSEQRINEMAAEYTRLYGKPKETPNSWRWKVPGKQDQLLNKPGPNATHSYGRAVDITIPGHPWGSNELRNVNRLAKALGLHGYKDTETKGHFNLPMDGSLDQGDAPPPAPAPMPALASANDVASGGAKGGGNVSVGGNTTNIVNAPTSSGGGGGNAYLTELWTLASGMDGALVGGFA